MFSRSTQLFVIPIPEESAAKWRLNYWRNHCVFPRPGSWTWRRGRRWMSTRGRRRCFWTPCSSSSSSSRRRSSSPTWCSSRNNNRTATSAPSNRRYWTSREEPDCLRMTLGRRDRTKDNRRYERRSTWWRRREHLRSSPGRTLSPPTNSPPIFPDYRPRPRQHDADLQTIASRRRWFAVRRRRARIREWPRRLWLSLDCCRSGCSCTDRRRRMCTNRWPDRRYRRGTSTRQWPTWLVGILSYNS